MLGGIAAAGAAKGLTLGPFGVANRVAPGISYGQAWGVEFFTTGLLGKCIGRNLVYLR